MSQEENVEIGADEPLKNFVDISFRRPKGGAPGPRIIVGCKLKRRYEIAYFENLTVFRDGDAKPARDISIQSFGWGSPFSKNTLAFYLTDYAVPDVREHSYSVMVRIYFFNDEDGGGGQLHCCG